MESLQAMPTQFGPLDGNACIPILAIYINSACKLDTARSAAALFVLEQQFRNNQS
jgi:hypothetical protein